MAQRPLITERADVTRRRAWVLVGALMTVMALSPAAARAAPLVMGLGGPAGFGPGNLPANDDGSTGEIDVSLAFPDGLEFFGMRFTSLYVNNNGNISFGGPLGTYTPEPFPVASLRIIAPWWGDVDTRGGGVPARNGVYYAVQPGRVVVTWHNVGYYGVHDDLSNDFQLILRAAGPGVGDFDVEFRYNRCEWTTGDASGGSGGFGGTPAQAGFDAGNLRDYVALPGSLTRRVLDLCTTSNVEQAGVWIFEIRSGIVSCPGVGDFCETGLFGVCNAGTRRCISPEESVCVADAEPEPEACDGEDDDCDGTTDEELGTTTCGVGRCQVTVANCAGGTPQSCVAGTPRDEICDRIDDDCDGDVDDLMPLVCGTGACLVTTEACIDGVTQVCIPGTGSIEICNGYDDDCNGVADDTLDACFARPDGGPPDTGPRDAGPRDAAVPADAPGSEGGMRDGGGACVGTRLECNPFQLEGRAGPGCHCRAAGRASRSPGVWLLGLVIGAVIARRRRTRTALGS